MNVSPGCISAKNTAWLACAPGMRLHVCERTVEKAAGAFDRKLFGDVDILAATVVAATRIALGVLVGQDGALGFEHGLADDVFGRDQLDLVTLAAKLVGDGARDFRVAVRQAAREKIQILRASRVRQRHHSNNPAFDSCRRTETPTKPLPLPLYQI